MRKLTDEQFEKFTKAREEVKNKILKFYEKDNKNELIRLITSNGVMSSLKKDYKITIEQKNEKPCIAIHASKALVINACFMLLSCCGDFYENLYKVLALKEMELSCGPWINCDAYMQPDTTEEMEVLKEMFLKSPEEIEKFKEQLKRD